MSEYTEKATHQVHQNLIEMRMRKGVTQEEMAERMHCSVDTISRFEREQAGADCLSKCIAYQEALGVRVWGFIDSQAASELMRKAERASESAIAEFDASDMPIEKIYRMYNPTGLSDGTNAVTYSVSMPYWDDELYHFHIGCVSQFNDGNIDEDVGYIDGWMSPKGYAADFMGRRDLFVFLDGESEELGREAVMFMDFLEAHPFEGDWYNVPGVEPFDAVLFIDEIYVCPKYRNRGVLTAMRAELDTLYGTDRIVFLDLHPFEFENINDPVMKPDKVSSPNWEADLKRNQMIAEHYGFTLAPDPEEDPGAEKYYAAKNMECLIPPLPDSK